MTRILVIFIATISLLSAKDHEFYVSITDMNLRNDTLQIAVKIFTHDAEYALKKESGQAIFLDPKSDQEKAFRHLRDYCSDHLKLSTASTTLPLHWIGHEYEDDVTWIYAHTVIDKESSILFVKNTLLTDHFPTQHNMVHLTVKNQTATQICNAQQKEVRFSVRR